MKNKVKNGILVSTLILSTLGSMTVNANTYIKNQESIVEGTKTPTYKVDLGGRDKDIEVVGKDLNNIIVPGVNNNVKKTTIHERISEYLDEMHKKPAEVLKDSFKISNDKFFTEICYEFKENSNEMFEITNKYINTITLGKVKPFKQGDKIMLPVRMLADIYNMDVKWDKKNNIATLITEKEDKIYLKLNKKTVILNKDPIIELKNKVVSKNNSLFIEYDAIPMILGDEVGTFENKKDLQLNNGGIIAIKYNKADGVIRIYPIN